MQAVLYLSLPLAVSLQQKANSHERPTAVSHK